MPHRMICHFPTHSSISRIGSSRFFYRGFPPLQRGPSNHSAAGRTGCPGSPCYIRVYSLLYAGRGAVRAAPQLLSYGGGRFSSSSAFFFFRFWFFLRRGNRRFLCYYWLNEPSETRGDCGWWRALRGSSAHDRPVVAASHSPPGTLRYCVCYERRVDRLLHVYAVMARENE